MERWTLVERAVQLGKRRDSMSIPSELDGFREVGTGVAEPRACFGRCNVVDVRPLFMRSGTAYRRQCRLSRMSSLSENEIGGRTRRPERRRVYSLCCATSLPKVKLKCCERRERDKGPTSCVPPHRREGYTMILHMSKMNGNPTTLLDSENSEPSAPSHKLADLSLPNCLELQHEFLYNLRKVSISRST